MNFLKYLILMIIITSGFTVETLYSQSKSTILAGKIFNEENGKPLRGATVKIPNQKKGSYTKPDGSFRIKNVKPGLITIQIFYTGYGKKEITDIEVKPNEVTTIEVGLSKEVKVTNKIVVSAKVVKETGAALLKQRQKADAVSDAIGAKEIARGGAGDAADAVKNITGATTVGGKHVYIRGLGDRYSNTQLNGAALPSADPDKKSVHLDLFPSGMIENITTIKTATPDKPGDFTGGTVDIKTKSFPDKFNMNVSMSGTYNSESSFGNMLTYDGGGTDWLGLDDGTRDVPSAISNQDIFPTINDARSKKNNPEAAGQLNKLSKSFSPIMAPSMGNANMNSSYSISVVDQFEIDENPLGFLASLSYGRKIKTYFDGSFGRYDLQNTTSTELFPVYIANDNKSVDEVAWGGLFNLAYNLNPKNTIAFNFIHNQSGESEARIQSAVNNYYPEIVGIQTRALKYTERTISTYQLKGDHEISFLNNANFNWNTSFSNTAQYEPDLRFFSNDIVSVSENQDGTLDTIFRVDDNHYDAPTRYFRDLTEDMLNTNFDLSIPLEEILNQKLNFKTGLAFNKKDRNFNEDRYVYISDDSKYGLNFNGDVNQFVADSTGIRDWASQGNFNYFGMYIEDRYVPKGAYKGEQEILATYAMFDWLLFDRVKIVAGARFESTDLSVISRDTTLPIASLTNNDLLPSLNLSYKLAKDMNIRAAYGKTLARPTFRELADYDSFDFVGGYTFIGNPNLKRTLIDNIDLRYEWFFGIGEIAAVSFFNKNFTNPIERVIVNANGNVQYQNVDEAKLYGFEFEVRKNLGFLGLEKFLLGANLTLVESEVSLSASELALIRAYDPDAKNVRNMQGQSPYVINMNLAYVDYENGTDVGLHFNVFGERLSEVSLGGTPDVYEQPKPNLNLVISQKVYESLKLKVSAKNLLNSSTKRSYEFLGKEYIAQEYNTGTDIKIGISYLFN